MDAHYQGLFVITTIKDADTTPLRQGLLAAPEVVMVQFGGIWGLEAGHLTALGIHPRHHMFDGAVLAGGVHRLENQQHAPTVLGVEAFLKFGKQAGAFSQALHRHRFVIPLQVQGVVGIDAGQAKALAIFHLIGLGEFVALAQQLVAIHGIDHGFEIRLNSVGDWPTPCR